MLNKSELKSLVKSYFQLTEANETQVVEKFEETTLEDGTRVTNMLDEPLAVGQELHIITEDDQHILAPAGDHILADGSVVTVDEEGKIVGLEVGGEEVEAETPATEAEEMSAETEEAPATEVELAEEGEEEMEEHEVAEEVVDKAIEEAIVSAIAEVVLPELEAVKAKLAEHEEKMKEYMSKPASKPTVDSQFSKKETKKKITEGTLAQRKNAFQMEEARKYFSNLKTK